MIGMSQANGGHQNTTTFYHFLQTSTMTIESKLSHSLDQIKLEIFLHIGLGPSVLGNRPGSNLDEIEILSEYQLNIE